MLEQLKLRSRITSRPVYTAVAALIAIGAVLAFRLQSLTLDAAASQELAAAQRAGNWSAIWHQPFYAPYTAVLRLFSYAGNHLLVWRSASLVLGLAAAGLVYFILHRWLGWRLATIGLVLFGTGSTLLHSARLVDPHLLQLLICLVLVAGVTASYKHPQPRHLLGWAIVLPLCLYQPGAIWLVIMTVVFMAPRLKVAWVSSTAQQRLGSVLLLLVLLVPLIHFLVAGSLHGQAKSTLGAWAGISLPYTTAAFARYAHNFVSLPISLFWHSSAAFGPALALPTAPMLNVVISVLVLLGLIISGSRWHDYRWRYLLLLLAVSWLAAGLGRLDSVVVIPLMYLLAAIGLAYLLSEWYRVFPHNPIARNTGFGLVVLLVGLSCFYNLRVYFVAWPHHRATVQAFICPVEPPRPAGCIQSDF